MTIQTHKKLLIILCVVCIGLFTATLKNPVEIAREKAVAQQEEARLKADKQQEEAEKQRAIAEAERQKKLMEERANMPPFSFSGFTLADSPQQVVEKGLKQFDVSTSFPVQQSSNSIKILTGEQNCGRIDYRSKSLDTFFSGFDHEDSYYWLGVSKAVLQSGFRIDVIQLEVDKWGNDRIQIHYYYYTIPGSAPKVLYMAVAGKLIDDVSAVFRERYGAPEWERHGRVWLSNTEAAICLQTNMQRVLYLVSRAGYDESRAYAAKIDARVREEDITKRAAEEAARKAKI